MVVNIGVLLSGVAIAIFGYQSIDLVTGLAIGVYVIREGFELWEDANEALGSD